MRNCNLLRLLTLSGFLSLAVLPRHAAAQWPTLDISSVKEGISTNIELVKQSKVVTDAMATAGKINAGIGDAKASVSKFAGDNLAKAQEKMKKLQEEKERIEKKKEEYEKIKKEIEEKKEAMEDYKRQAEALKADAEGYIADAKEMKDAASDVVSTVKDDVSSASSSAGVSSGNADLNTTSAVAEAEPQTAVSGRTAFGSAQSESGYQVAAPTSDAKNYGEAVSETSAVAGISEVAEDDTAEADVQALAEEQSRLKEEQETLDKEKAELEVDAMFAKTPEEKAAVEEKMKALDAKYEDLNGRMSENAAQLAAAQEQTAAEAAVETPAENKAVPAGRRPFGMPEKPRQLRTKIMMTSSLSMKRKKTKIKNRSLSIVPRFWTEKRQPKWKFRNLTRQKFLKGKHRQKWTFPNLIAPKFLILMKRRSITRRKFLSKVGSSREILQGASAKEPYKEVRLSKMAVIMLPAAFPRQLSLPIWRGGPYLTALLTASLFFRTDWLRNARLTLPIWKTRRLWTNVSKSW